jgi:hypothetical protein
MGVLYVDSNIESTAQTCNATTERTDCRAGGCEKVHLRNWMS